MLRMSDGYAESLDSKPMVKSKNEAMSGSSIKKQQSINILVWVGG